MRIQSANIHASAAHSFQRTLTRTQSVESWIKPMEAPVSVLEQESLPGIPESARSSSLSAETMSSVTLSPKNKLILEIIRRMIKTLTGRDWDLQVPEGLPGKLPEVGMFDPLASASPQAMTQPGQVVAEFGVIAVDRLSVSESESTEFEATGTVKTEDGRELPFSVHLNMSRAFFQEIETSLRLGETERKVDPLVINLDGQGASLEPDARFEFDLDLDGMQETLSELRRGSGFLALDKNGDGQINDGGELFGAANGDGFAELAAYDDTGDGVIDENDGVFQRLRVWQREGGESRLVALGQVDVGAIFIGHLTTPFRITNEQNQGLGEVRSTGIFIRDSGAAGTVQQLDYLV